MKTMKFAIGAAFVLSMLATGAARAAITGTSHDLSLAGTTELCAYCHTPHNGDDGATPMSAAPLWNRNITSTTFTMYDSPTREMVMATDPQGVSLACLSCHDGVTGYDNVINLPFGETFQNVLMNGVAPQKAVGGDASGLGNDHPISITYDPAVDPDFDTLANAKAAGLPFFDLAAGSADQVECATCHDPHDGATLPNFLRIANTGSDLCKTCHTK